MAQSLSQAPNPASPNPASVGGGNSTEPNITIPPTSDETAFPHLKEYVVNALCPRILVLASPEAHTLVQRQYHLSRFVDLLRPFGVNIPLQCPLQDGQGRAYMLDTLDVKFVDASPGATSLAATAPQVPGENMLSDNLADSGGLGKELVQYLCTRMAQDSQAEATTLPDPVTQRLQQADIDDWTPWYPRQRQQVMQTIAYSEHESFTHPVACIFVVASSHPDPVKAYLELSTCPLMSNLRQHSYSGSDLPILYVMVHDEQHVSLAESEVKFEHTRRTISQLGLLLKLNAHRATHDLIPELGKPLGHEELNCSELWANHHRIYHDFDYPLTGETEITNTERPGQWLASTDLAAIRGLLKGFLNRQVLMYMQRCIRDLTEQVASSRRGLTGRLFSAGRKYFGNQSKLHIVPSTLAPRGTPGSSGVPYIYDYDSAESKLRKLADYAFMLKDYPLALSIYQTAKRDYANDRMLAYLAGAQEMIGICKLFTNLTSTRLEYDSNFEEAVALYNRCRLSDFSVRTTVMYYELLKSRQLYHVASMALTRASLDRSSTVLPFLFEQAAYCQLKTPIPHARKFVFYLVISARQFSRFNHQPDAVRCYQIAEALFSNKLWVSAEKYLYHALGHQAVLVENYKQAIPYYLSLLTEPMSVQKDRPSGLSADSLSGEVSGSPQPASASQSDQSLLLMSRLSPEFQTLYLNELLYLYSNNIHMFAEATDFHIPELALPWIPNRSVMINTAPLSSVNATDCLFDWKTHVEYQLADRELVHQCSPDEKVRVSFIVANPLRTELVLQNITVQCEYHAPGEPAQEVVDGREEVPLDIPDCQTNYSSSVIQELKIGGSEQRVVELYIVPSVPGDYRVSGVRYLLMGILPCVKRFQRRGPRLNATKDQRLHRKYGPDRSLHFKVNLSLPYADVSVVNDFPSSIQSGECQAIPVVVTNRGYNTPIDVVSVWCSHPSFFFVGDITHPDANFYGDSQPSTERSLHAVKEVSNQLADQSLLHLILQDPLQSENSDSTDQILLGTRRVVALAPLTQGQQLTIPLWVRGDRVGVHDFTLYIAYGCRDLLVMDPSLIHTVKYVHRCQVQPSLKINAFVRPGPSSETGQLLGIEVENLQSDKTFQLLQVTSISPSFTVESIDPPADLVASSPTVKNRPNATHLAPSITTTLYFRIQSHPSPPDSPPTKRHLPENFTVDGARHLVLGTPRRMTQSPEITLGYTNAMFTDYNISCDQNPLQGFLHSSRVAWRRKYLENVYPGLTSGQIRDVFTTFESYDLDLILLWTQHAVDQNGTSSAPPRCQGHHSITGINLGVPLNYLRGGLPFVSSNPVETNQLGPASPASPYYGYPLASPGTPSMLTPSIPQPSAENHMFGNVLFSQTLQEKWGLLSSLTDPPRLRSQSKQLLRVNISCTVPEEGDNAYHHSFTADGPLMLKVHLHVSNLTWCNRLTGSLYLQPVNGAPTAMSPTGSGSQLPAHSPNAAWVGQTEVSVNLEPFASVSLHATLCIPHSGTYNIQAWRFVGEQEFLTDRILPEVTNSSSDSATKIAKSSTKGSKKPLPSALGLENISRQSYPFVQTARGTTLVTVVAI
ncbi:hypothetical protein IWQ62_001320 [Dispira parvispora]|uniref:ER-golgi trafficking TRAPP I complex 85 kDa subunit-domain-containing protein n=1 Tax=Dispira parvispora TaxID=1520584 RepID=A0A9W8AY91_9FUNG|nr:hypothetical protein IWQ62_001320 [Dispira parvispora]